MSFNLLSTNESYPDVIEYIQANRPDLVFLHEASRPWEVAMESAPLDYEVIRPRSDEPDLRHARSGGIRRCRSRLFRVRCCATKGGVGDLCARGLA